MLSDPFYWHITFLWCVDRFNVVMLGVVTVSITRDKPLEPDLDQPISALHVGAED